MGLYFCNCIFVTKKNNEKTNIAVNAFGLLSNSKRKMYMGFCQN